MNPSVEVVRYIRKGSLDKLSELLKKYYSNNEGEDYKYFIHFTKSAIRSGNVDVLKCILSHLNPKKLPDTILNDAISSQEDISLIKIILPYVESKSRLPALYLATVMDNKPVINLLFDLDIYSKTKEVLDYNGENGPGVNYIMSLANNEATKKYLQKNITPKKRSTKSRVF